MEAYIAFASIRTIRTKKHGYELLVGPPPTATLPDLGPSLLAGFAADGGCLRTWLLLLKESNGDPPDSEASQLSPCPPPRVIRKDGAIDSVLVQAPIRVVFRNKINKEKTQLVRLAVEQRRIVVLRLTLGKQPQGKNGNDPKWQDRVFTLEDIELIGDR